MSNSPNMSEKKHYKRNSEVLEGGDVIFPEGMQRIALGIEYAGYFFHGFQSQPHDPQTIQEGIEKALSAIANEPVKLVCAGRTDAGVHATNQVVHFDTVAKRADSAWLRGANTQLPEGIAIRWVKHVSPDFHSRFSARSRTYRYVIYNTQTPSALLNHYVTWDRRRLDVALMVEASQALLGEHDFSAFRAIQCQANNPVRRMKRIDITQHNDFIVIEVEATAFLYHMVRNIVGVLSSIAAGEKPVAWAAEVLASRDRQQGGVTAPSDGLYLVSVEYDNKYNLPVRAKGPYFLA
jgi:tRNA pseudouridine38-40 synthase